MFTWEHDVERVMAGVSVPLNAHEIHWKAFLKRLKDSGLHGKELITSDNLEGLEAVRRAVFVSIPWPKCLFHLQ